MTDFPPPTWAPSPGGMSAPSPPDQPYIALLVVVAAALAFLFMQAAGLAAIAIGSRGLVLVLTLMLIVGFLLHVCRSRWRSREATLRAFAGAVVILGGLLALITWRLGIPADGWTRFDDRLGCDIPSWYFGLVVASLAGAFGGLAVFVVGLVVLAVLRPWSWGVALTMVAGLAVTMAATAFVFLAFQVSYATSCD